jgi:hypothetical protein
MFEAIRASHILLLGNGTSAYTVRAREKLNAVEFIFGGAESPWTQPQTDGFVATVAAKHSVLEARKLLRVYSKGAVQPYSLPSGRRMEPLYTPGKSRAHKVSRCCIRASLIQTMAGAFEANAEYRALDNSLVFNIGLMQYMQLYTSHLKRMATVGFVIGHELSHAIDPNGIWFSADGTPKPFGKAAEIRESMHRFRCYVDLADSYGQDGVRTLNENFADGNGLRAALHALGAHTTNDFRLFAATFSSLWCNLGHEYGDTHAPGLVRAKMSLEGLGEVARQFPMGLCAQRALQCGKL